MQEFQFIVEPYLSGVRIDTFLQRHLRTYTTWRLHRMVAAGLVSIDDLSAEVTQRVFSGQSVSVRLVEPPDKILESYFVELTVVYEDPWLLVVDKPIGLVAHPVGDFQEGTLSNAVQFHLDRQTKANGLLRPGIVHRLDRMTSGLIVVAKEHMSHRQLSVDFQKGRTQKAYFALVEGCPDFESRRIDIPIGMRPGNNSVLMSAKVDAKRPRTARTDVSVVERFDDVTLVKCVLHTGRNHQIRVHLAEIGYPVLGDEYYGPHGSIRRAPRFDGEIPTTQRHALHACLLAFEHPVLKTRMEFQSHPPDDFWCGMSEQQRLAASV